MAFQSSLKSLKPSQPLTTEYAVKSPNRSSWVLGVAIALSSVAGAYAQTPAVPLSVAGVKPEEITISQALALAEEFSPRLTFARSQVEAARAGITTARAYPNPELDAGWTQFPARVGVGGALRGSGQTLGIAQLIDLPSVRAPRSRIAESSLGVALALSADVRLQLRASVKQAYVEGLRRRAEAELLADNERLIREIRNRVEIRVNVGEAARFELVRADAELASAANLTNSARLRAAQALANLRAVIGAPLGTDLDVSGEMEGSKEIPSLDVLRQQAIERQPILRANQQDVARAQARLETERALRTPAPVVRAGAVRDPQANELRIGVSIPLPLWNRREGPIGEAVAGLQQANAALDLRRIELFAAVDAAVSRYRVATQQIAAFEGGLLRQAEAALRVAEAAFRFGERGFIDVLDAQRVLRSVRLDFLAARFELQAALVEIERLRVADLPPD